MSVGEGCFIGEGCKISAIGGFVLGNYCALAANTTVITTDHRFRGAESIPWGEARAVKPVVIEDYGWIGMNVSILPGVRIGEGAVVGMGAVISKDVPPKAIIVGNPAQVVGYRDAAAFENHKRANAVKPPSQHCCRLIVEEATWERFGYLLQDFANPSARYGALFRITSSGEEVPIGIRPLGGSQDGP
jgi:maltose O-acetyltransferase